MRIALRFSIALSFAHFPLEPLPLNSILMAVYGYSILPAIKHMEHLHKVRKVTRRSLFTKS